jgi:hypothetical protein
MSIKVNCTTQKGGAVELNKEHDVWVSYAVATSGNKPPGELFFANIKLKDNSDIQLFVNRETSLVVLDHISKDGRSGTEVYRRQL